MDLFRYIPNHSIVICEIASQVVPGGRFQHNPDTAIIIGKITCEVVVVRVFNMDSGDVVEPCVVPVQVVVIATRLEVNTELLVWRGSLCTIRRVEGEEVTVGVVQLMPA